MISTDLEISIKITPSKGITESNLFKVQENSFWYI